MPFSTLFAILSLSAFAEPTDTPIVGLPCQGCSAALEGMPKEPPTVSTLTAPDEPGDRLRLTGQVRDLGGQPQPGIIVYAYQTDHAGAYPPLPTAGSADARRHGRLRGWARTDAQGNYTFLTVRPGGYPGSTQPQHIHLHVVEPSCATYYIDDVMFRDDPRLDARVIERMDVGRGGSGIVTPERRGGIWQARRDIVLGQQIPDYPTCARAPS